MFGIFPTNVVIEENDELVLPASIVIDSFSESFNIPLAYWGVEDYRIHWINSLGEGLKSKKHSVLAVSMYEPSTKNFIFAWALYFSGEDVFVKNIVIFIDECPGFTSEKLTITYSRVLLLMKMVLKFPNGVQI